jgi:ABC-type lipoprotein release transport system permease subunit
VSKFLLLLRNLFYFRWANLALVAGMAVATAVLTGALMVGDSVRGSLRELAQQRLGKVDYALVATRFFEQSLAQRVGTPGKTDVVPAVILRGGASDESGQRRTAGVQIAALGGDWVPAPRGNAVVNGELARDLGLNGNGETLLLTLPAIHDTPGEATLARRSRQEALSGMRVTAEKVVSDPGFVSMFSLEGSQRVPRNAWVNLLQLQQAVDQRGRVNALLADELTGKGDPGSVEALNTKLREVVTLADYGLSLAKGGNNEAVLGSRSTYLEPPVVRAATDAARALSVPVRSVNVYLVNALGVEAPNGKAIHYAIVAGMSDVDGKPLRDDEIVLNEWAAGQLGAKPGDAIRLKYYQRQPNGDLNEVTSDRPFKVARVIPMTGLGADKSLTPEYKGLTDAESISDWDPPQGVNIDKSLVTKEDEAYWHQYKAAPKAFVSFEAAKKLWGGVYGDVTSVRVPADKMDAFGQELRKRIDPKDLGLTFRPIRAEQLAAASGSTDFAMLFVGFSFFLIAAAALLVAMLFRLNIEQRARQVGLLSAVGFAPKALRRLALEEGMLLALIGGLIGLAGAVGYTWHRVTGLGRGGGGGVGTTAMRLFVEPQTLVIGLLASLAVAFFAILWAVWHVGRTEAARLLAGGRYAPVDAKKGRSGLIALAIAFLAGAGGLAMLALGISGAMAPKNAFLGGGSLLLIAALSFVANRLRPRRHTASSASHLSLLLLGVRNATRHTARSVLSVGLIAFAAFTLVTVAAMKEGPPTDTDQKTSGAGGYRLILQADIPLGGDLGSEKGREILGVQPAKSALWDRVKFMSMRSWAGQDISCLNLTRPSTPTILAVPHAMVERGGFTSGKENLLARLEQPIVNNEVPVMTDTETATYILKLGIGKTMDITDQRGVPRKLKLVGTLDHSIFQSEMLMGEANFRELFPAQSGFGTVLVEVSAADEEPVRKALLSNLGDYSVTVDRTADRLASYAQVKNTYLSTFQTLGSLGLMLGTIGLAVVLLRNLVERRAELALLSALGWSSGGRVAVVLWENSMLLLVGLGVGAGCALVAISPSWIGGGRGVNFGALAATLGGVLVVGLGGLAAAVWLGQRRVSAADLRAE